LGDGVGGAVGDYLGAVPHGLRNGWCSG
jgi:hypothetical protein